MNRCMFMYVCKVLLECVFFVYWIFVFHCHNPIERGILAVKGVLPCKVGYLSSVCRVVTHMICGLSYVFALVFCDMKVCC